MKTKLEKVIALCKTNIRPDLDMGADDWMEYMSDLASGGNHDDTFTAGEAMGAHDLAGTILNILNKE